MSDYDHSVKNAIFNLLEKELEEQQYRVSFNPALGDTRELKGDDFKELLNEVYEPYKDCAYVERGLDNARSQHKSKNKAWGTVQLLDPHKYSVGGDDLLGSISRDLPDLYFELSRELQEQVDTAKDKAIKDTVKAWLKEKAATNERR